MSSFAAPKFDELTLYDDRGGEPGDLFTLSGWATKGRAQPSPRLTGPDKSYAQSQTAAEAAKASPTTAIATSVAAGLSKAYSAFHAVSMQQIELRQAADAMSHRARLIDLDARAAYRAAERELQVGQDQISQVGLEGVQRRSAINASAAARGVDSTSGSGAEVQASQRLVEAIDVYNINLASVEASNARRSEGVAARNEALMSRVSARNARRTAKYSDPVGSLVLGLANYATAGAGAGGL